MDMEGIHTYEGTYDINNLVGARELTGHAAFKWISSIKNMILKSIIKI